MAAKFPGMERLSRFFASLDPKRKKQLAIAALVLGPFLAITLGVIATDDGQRQSQAGGERKVEYSVLGTRDPRAVSLDAVAGSVKKLTADYAALKLHYSQEETKLNAALETVKAQNANLQEKTEQLGRQAELLAKATEESKKANEINLPPVPGKQTRGGAMPFTPGNPALSSTSAEPPIPQGPGSTGLKIKVVSASGPQGEAKDQNGKDKPSPASAPARIKESINAPDQDRLGKKFDAVLPGGSIISGTLITGLDAPSSNQARRDPMPSLLRVKHDAILPNRYRMDIKECFVIAGGYGDLSSERAYMRAESLSCVKQDGTVIDATMDAYAVGEDGKAGIRGRVVSKNGQIIANTLLSGLVAGIGKSFAVTRVQPININPSNGSTQEFQYPSPQMMAAQAAGGAIRGASEQIAEYYLDMAKNIFPVIEIDAGRKVDFVMIRGISLKPSQGSYAQGRNGPTPPGFNPWGGGKPQSNGITGALSGATQSLSLPGSAGNSILNSPGSQQPLLR